MNYTIHSSLIWVWVLGVVLMGCGDGTIEVISYNVKASFGDSDRAMHQAERVAAVMNAVRPPAKAGEARQSPAVQEIGGLRLGTLKSARSGEHPPLRASCLLTQTLGIVTIVS